MEYCFSVFRHVDRIPDPGDDVGQPVPLRSIGSGRTADVVLPLLAEYVQAARGNVFCIV